MASAAAQLEQVIAGIDDMNLSRQMLVASVGIMTYDWLLTLSDEVRLLWPARWSTVKVIYLLNRYIMPLTIFFAVYGWSGFATFFVPLTCKIWISTDSFVLLTSFAGLHYIVSLRAWALWGRDKVVGLVLWGALLLYMATAFTITGKAMISIDSSVQPFIDVCFGPLPNYLWSIWLPSIVYESLVFSLTAIKAYQHSQNNVETPILTVLYRDGFLYFIFISICSFANLMWWALAAQTRVLVIKYITVAICQVAGSHLVLDLLSVGHKTGSSIAPGTSHPGIIRKPSPMPLHSLKSGEAFEMQVTSIRSPDEDRLRELEKSKDNWPSAFSSYHDTLTVPAQMNGLPFEGPGRDTVSYEYPSRNPISNSRSIHWSDRTKAF